MYNIKKAVIFFLLVLSCQVLFATDNLQRKTITFKDALAIYRTKSNDIKIAKIGQKQSKRDASFAKSWIPSLDVAASAAYPKIGTFTPNKEKWDVSGAPNIGVTVGATFSLNASNFTSIFSSIVADKLSSYNYKSTIDLLEFQLYTYYLNLASSIEAFECGRKALDTAKVEMDNTQRRFDLGLVDSLQLMNAKLAYSNAERNYISLEASRDNAYLTLKNMLRLDYDFDIDDMNELAFIDIPSADELYKKHISTNGTIKPLKLQYDSYKVAYTTANLAMRLPTLSASLKYTYADMKGTNANDNVSLTFSAAMSLDSFIPGTDSWNKISASKDALDIAKLKLDDGFYKYREQIDTKLNNIKLCKSSYNSAYNALELQSESYRLTKDAYDRGALPMSTFSTSMEGLLNAELSLIKANFQYKLAVYELANYLGVDFEKFVDTYKK